MFIVIRFTYFIQALWRHNKPLYNRESHLRWGELSLVVFEVGKVPSWQWISSFSPTTSPPKRRQFLSLTFQLLYPGSFSRDSLLLADLWWKWSLNCIPMDQILWWMILFYKNTDVITPTKLSFLEINTYKTLDKKIYWS